MIGRLVLLSALAVSFVAADFYKPDYANEVAADKDYLLKVQRIYQTLYHVGQPQIKADIYKEGQDYKIEMDNYSNKEAVTEFLHYMEHGFIPQDAVYSIYYEKFRDEAMVVFKLMYYAKDFDTFMKTAYFCRNRVNHSLFGHTFYLAVIHRPDTKYIRLPPLYEMIPHFFYNVELLEKAHHPQAFGHFEPKHTAGYDAYILPYNYSNYYLTDEYDYEQRLNYFVEDIGLNNYYAFVRSGFPTFLSSEEMGWKQNYRGEEYLYVHKHLLSRYHLERLSNELGHVEDYDYDRTFYPGYWPSMSYPNGMHFPSRPAESYFPKSKLHKIHESEEIETRISQAVDSGYVFTKEGKPTKLYTPDGLNILGNLIEGNMDSANQQYYGQLERLQRNILGFNLEPLTPTKLHPSAMESPAANLRDPAFWRMYKKLLHFYAKYKKNQGPYKPEEIQYPELKIESVETDKLITYFDLFDSTISNALAVSSAEEAEKFLVQVRQHRLNHKSFKVYFNINAEKPTKAAVRLFLGPKYNVHMKELDFSQHHNDFYEMDYFVYDLAAGNNKFERSCHDFFMVSPDQEPSEVYYKKLLKAIETGEELKYYKNIMGFPHRLLLPKGKPEGMPFQFFIHVAPVIGEQVMYQSKIFGEAMMDNRPFGYPLDRPISDLDFHGSNFFFKDVLITHQVEHDHTVTF